MVLFAEVWGQTHRWTVNGYWWAKDSAQMPIHLLHSTPIITAFDSLNQPCNTTEQAGFPRQHVTACTCKICKTGELITGNTFVPHPPDLPIVTAYWNIEIIYMNDVFFYKTLRVFPNLLIYWSLIALLCDSLSNF